MATPMSAVEQDPEAFDLVKSDAITLGENIQDASDIVGDVKVDAAL